jgi:DNA-binding GntR family transcriptional regulator
MREEVYETIKKWIVEGVLHPGEKLTDAELATQLGVSRTPVREAFRRLDDEGLLQTARNRWTRVSEIDVEQAEHIYPIVWSLESLAASIAYPKMESEDFEAMSAANLDLKQALEDENSVEAVSKDAEFHGVFVARSGNPYLIDSLEQAKVRLRRLEVAYFEGSSIAVPSLAEHERIIKAFRSKDAERVPKVVAENWQRSLDRFRKELARQRSSAPSDGVKASMA